MELEKQRMQQLVTILNEASKAYYQQASEIMTNREYDELYDELVELEKELGIVMASSPTVNVGYEVLSALPKESHQFPMLSLDKTKDMPKLKEFIGDRKAVLSWKLDGLTIVLTYRGGMLEKAVTRGNGEVGEVITNNARVFQNVPVQISYSGELVLRGEAVIGYKDFEKINEEIGEDGIKYKNPRNLCSGSVRQLNNEITAKRNVHFFAFSLVKAEGVDFQNSRKHQLKWLAEQGIDVIKYQEVTQETVEQVVADFEKEISKNDYPSDGLVITYDDIAYGNSLGATSKFPKDAIAFKWEDEIKETELLEIEWSLSRTGLINPIAIFEPVDLEGTTVSRASVHNLSILEELALGIGDKIEVYKANMIIPQIADNLTRSGPVEIPDTCLICGGATEIKQVSDAKTLHCMNPDCQVRHLKSFTLFVSRNALNVEGLSEATLEKFIKKGFIKEYADIFHLSKFQDEIQEMEGFGEKSYANLIASIDKARTTTLPNVIYGLGIANVGLAGAKLICSSFANQIELILDLRVEQLSEIHGVGEVIAKSFVDYFADDRHRKEFERLLEELVIPTIPTAQTDESKQIFEKINFVITGSMNHFSNRDEVKELIESKGGKVTGSVTSKTNYLINNDKDSTSSKNKKAKELGIPIISEEEFREMLEKETSQI